MPKKKKKSFQRTVAEAPGTPKKLREAAIAGETMKLHTKRKKSEKAEVPHYEKMRAAEKKRRGAEKKTILADDLHRSDEQEVSGEWGSYDARMLNNARKALGESPLTKGQIAKLKKLDKTSRKKVQSAYEKEEEAGDVWRGYRAETKDIASEAKSLTKRRSPSATVGKAGKEMETRRRKKKKDY